MINPGTMEAFFQHSSNLQRSSSEHCRKGHNITL